MLTFFLVLVGYLCGSVSFGLLLTRNLKGVDLRSQGSGNIGATNVARTAGKKLGLVVLVLDAAKGALPVALALWLLPEAPRVHAAVGLAAVLGHVFPAWLRLRGGKGVATSLGVLLVLVPQAALAGAVTYGVIVGALRVSSVGSLAAGLVTLLSAWALTRLGRPADYAVLATAFLGLMLFTHRSNLRRLWLGVERKL